MKKIYSFLLSACLLLLATDSWGATYSFTPNGATTGSSATTYVTTLTEFTYNGISWKMNQWNPSSLQIKTNQSSASSEFRFYNTSAIPGKITQVVINLSSLTVSDATGFKFKGGASEVTSTSGGTSGTWNASAKTITWTPGESDNFTYFAFYQNGKVASGSNYLAESNAIVVTYTPNRPTIDTQPVGASYTTGATATPLTVAATTSKGTLHYQWKSNTTNSVEGASNVGTDAASYTPSTASAGTTYYFCVVSDDNGSTNTTIVSVVVSDPVAATSISLDKSTLTLKVGGSFTFTPTITPADASVVWESDDNNIATISSTGTVSAISMGSARITIKSVVDNSINAYCDVTVGHVNSLVFTSSCGGSGTADDGTVWAVTSDADESSYDGDKGIHYGTGSAAVSYLKLKTQDIFGTITKIVVNASGASKTTAKLNVTVGGSAFGSQQDLSSTATAYTLTGSASGEIEVAITQSSQAKAVYCKSIEVTISEMTANLNNKDGATYGFATFCGSKNFTIVPEDGKEVKAYKASLSGSTLTLEEVTGIIPEEEGIILAGDKNAEYSIVYTTKTATADMDDNDLLGTLARTESTELLETGYDKVMVFDKTANSFVSHTGSGKYIPAHKAFLLNPEGSSPAPAIHLEFNEENNATNLNNLETSDKVVKFFENGKLLIMREGVVYDALGRIVK